MSPALIGIISLAVSFFLSHPFQGFSGHQFCPCPSSSCLTSPTIVSLRLLLPYAAAMPLRPAMLISSMTTQSPVRLGSPVFGPVTEELREALLEDELVELLEELFEELLEELLEGLLEELFEELFEELSEDELDPGESVPGESVPGESAVHFAYSVRSAVTGVVKLYAFRHCASVYQPPKV